MIRASGLGFALVVWAAALAVPTPTIADSQLTGTDGARDQRNLPMQFTLRLEGPAQECGTSCRQWVSAYGAITPDSARDFLDFAKGKELRGLTIAFDSDGGSTHGALALGREIRRLEMVTTVGRAVEVPGETSRARLDAKADCESMCAFLLLAGTRRFVPPEARVLVHQIWLGDRRDDPTASSYSAEDLVLVQRDIGRMAQYTVEMGANAELLELALRIPPWEPMRQLTRDELKRMQLLTMDTAFEPSAPPSPAARATNATPATGDIERPRANRRAWAFLEGSDGTALTRRHPITVEGDEIGGFDLTFACGPTADTYLLSYSEWRRGREGDHAPAALSNVTAFIAQKPLTMKVASSTVSEVDRAELDTFASVAVPVDTVRALAVSNSRSMIVATAGGGAETSIRIGNTGLSHNFPMLAASCEKALLAKAVATKAEPPAEPRKKTGALANAN